MWNNCTCTWRINTKLQDSCMFNFGELHQIKNEQEWIICVKTKTIKLLQKSIRKYFCNLGVNKYFSERNRKMN